MYGNVPVNIVTTEGDHPVHNEINERIIPHTNQSNMYLQSVFTLHTIKIYERKPTVDYIIG